jgi:hypothetical protein
MRELLAEPTTAKFDELVKAVWLTSFGSRLR